MTMPFVSVLFPTMTTTAEPRGALPGPMARGAGGGPEESSFSALLQSMTLPVSWSGETDMPDAGTAEGRHALNAWLSELDTLLMQMMQPHAVRETDAMQEVAGLEDGLSDADSMETGWASLLETLQTLMTAVPQEMARFTARSETETVSTDSQPDGLPPARTMIPDAGAPMRQWLIQLQQTLQQLQQAGAQRLQSAAEAGTTTVPEALAQSAGSLEELVVQARELVQRLLDGETGAGTSPSARHHGQAVSSDLAGPMRHRTMAGEATGMTPDRMVRMAGDTEAAEKGTTEAPRDTFMKPGGPFAWLERTVRTGEQTPQTKVIEPLRIRLHSPAQGERPLSGMHETGAGTGQGQGAALMAQPIDGRGGPAGAVPASVSMASAGQMIAEPIRHPDWGQALAQRVMLLAQSGQQRAEIRLNPAHLGPIQVQLQMDADQGIQVSLQAHHVLTREAIEQALPRLKELFDQQQIPLAGASVDQSPFSRQSGDEHTRRHGNVTPLHAGRRTDDGGVETESGPEAASGQRRQQSYLVSYVV